MSEGVTGIYDTGIRPAIDEHLLKLASQRRDYGKYWSASSAGYCQRKVIFDRLQLPHTSEDPRRQRIFTAGHIFHDWIQGITKETGMAVAQEMELIDDGIMVKGHFDDLVMVDGKLILYDYKTQNSRAFQWQKKNGTSMSYFHRLQLGTYMYMIRSSSGSPSKSLVKAAWGSLSEARILKISKDDLCMSEQILLWSDELEKDVLDYWGTLQAFWDMDGIPPCTCADHEGGFMAKEAYNPYWYDGEPCSLAWYEKCKAEGLIEI